MRCEAACGLMSQQQQHSKHLIDIQQHEEFEWRMPSALNFCYYAQLWLTAFAVDSADNGLFRLSLHRATHATMLNMKLTMMMMIVMMMIVMVLCNCGRIVAVQPSSCPAQPIEVTQLTAWAREMTRAFQTEINLRHLASIDSMINTYR